MRKRIVAISATLGIAALALAAMFAPAGAEGVRAHVDANGMLKGYIVQKNGRTICRNPLVWNQFRGPESYIVCDSEDDTPPSEYMDAHVNTNGVLKGYIVQKDGKDICRDPEVWLNFRGAAGYIVCD